MSAGTGWTKRWGRREGRSVGIGAGFAVEVRAFDQWAAAFHPLIEAYSAPTALCGYTTLAVAQHMVAELGVGTTRGPVYTPDEVGALLDALGSVDAFVPRVEAQVAAIHATRTAYVDAHADAFADAGARRKYMADWVANFEITAELAAWRASGGADSIVFVRNVERDDDCEHEEAARLVDELPFQHVTLFFDVGGALVLPSAFRAACPEPTRSVFIVDTLGHFVVALPIFLAADPADPDALTPLLLVINTSAGDYVDRVQLKLLYRAVFEGASEDDDPEFLYSGTRFAPIPGSPYAATPAP